MTRRTRDSYSTIHSCGSMHLSLPIGLTTAAILFLYTISTTQQTYGGQFIPSHLVWATTVYSHNLCLYCGSKDHLIPDSQVRPTQPMVSAVQFPLTISSLKRTPVSVIAPRCSLTTQALIDSAGNFISQKLLEHVRIKKLPSSQTLNIHSAYSLICIRKGDEWKTTFITPSGTMNTGLCRTG